MKAKRLSVFICMEEGECFGCVLAPYEGQTQLGKKYYLVMNVSVFHFNSTLSHPLIFSSADPDKFSF